MDSELDPVMQKPGGGSRKIEHKKSMSYLEKQQ